MSSPTEQIKERLPIDQVISSYIKIDRAGANYKARCPFHSEKTPSFIVSPSRNTYHCFGCNRGGDIFSFVEEIEGVDFRRALEILADRAGIDLPRIDPRLKSEEGNLLKILDAAASYYEERLSANNQALEYLKGRGLADETVSSWRIGYAEDEWRGLLSYLKGKKFSEPEIEKAGLIIRSEKGFYDRFRGRIMFPLRNAQGKIVGFSGRYFAKGKPETDTAKYINTPETPLFSKSRVLFGYDRAKQAIMREDFAVLVEGQNTTTLSRHDLALLRRRRIGFVFQTFNLIPVLSAFENVEYPLILKGLAAPERQRRVAQALEAVGLDGHAAHRPDELSGGQQQRVSIARALIGDPALVLADEPTANLDSETGEAILDIMHKLNQQQQTTFVFSSHDPKVINRASRVIWLKDGRIVSGS